MLLTETIKLKLNKEQKKLVITAMKTYISAVNDLVKLGASGVSITKFSSKDVHVGLPSAVRTQIAQDARSILKKHYKKCHQVVIKNRKRRFDEKKKAPKLPVVKKPCCYWNNQNFKLVTENDVTYLNFPVMINGKSTRISVRMIITDRQRELLENRHLGTMRIVFKSNKLVAQITYEKEEPMFIGNKTMGVDLGIKVPAVSYTSDGHIKFYGNGRKNKYIRRHFAYLRKKLQNKKRIKEVKRISNKEQRIMKDIDHKISRAIVDEAIKRNVDTIKLEQLSNIRSTTRKSRENNHSLHTWSFYRLASYIEYKAALVGIKVAYVNPAYTSQKCPVCGNLNHAEDRNYGCQCGHKSHRDIVGAKNICMSTEIVGKRLSA